MVMTKRLPFHLKARAAAEASLSTTGRARSTGASAPSQSSSMPLPRRSSAPGWIFGIVIVAVAAAEARGVAVVIVIGEAARQVQQHLLAHRLFAGEGDGARVAAEADPGGGETDGGERPDRRHGAARRTAAAREHDGEHRLRDEEEGERLGRAEVDDAPVDRQDRGHDEQRRQADQRRQHDQRARPRQHADDEAREAIEREPGERRQRHRHHRDHRRGQGRVALGRHLQRDGAVVDEHDGADDAEG